MKEHKKRFRIEFTVNVRNEGFDREDWDWSDEHIKSFALQELTCMSPFPEDITFSEVEDDWNTGTQTHGRLVDADSVKKIIRSDVGSDCVECVEDVCRLIDEMPTVIEDNKERK